MALGMSTQAQPLPEAGNFKITPEMLRFRYQAFDGSVVLQCHHEIQNELSQDWKVQCQNPEGTMKRSYVVHLWLTAYSRQQAPRLSYELLYWISDHSHPAKIQSSGSTIWFHLNDPSALHSLQASESVENDTAGLYLDLKTSG
jgi:hypothetical protein